VYIVHLAAKEALDAVASARDRGQNAFAETCPQYLYFSLEEQLDQPDFEGAKYVCSTPIRKRSEGHQDRLWQGLATNDLQVVSTDHCPFCFNDHPTLGTQKKLGIDDFTAIPNGMPTVENRFELLYHGSVALGHLSLNRFVEVVATTPAKMFGLYPQKGTIAVGSDADIVILDPGRPHVISAATHHMNVDYSAWEGYEVTGSVVKVLSRGRLIVDDGEYLGSKGDGSYLRRGTNQYLI
jgi:dihydropyrimidinase